MSRELKIGILTLLAITSAIWGFKFIQGKNVFSNNNTFNIIYDNVDQLTVSAPVLINGYEVGNVTKILLNPEDVNNIIVTIEVKNEIDIPKDAIAYLAIKDIMGNKVIDISYKNYCTGPDCAESGDFLEGGMLSLVDKMLGAGGDDKVMEGVKTELTGVIDTLAMSYAGKDVKQDVQGMVSAMKGSLENLESITDRINRLVTTSFKDIDKTMENLEAVTSNIADNNEKINAIFSNLESLSKEISESNPGDAITNANEALKETKITVESLRETLASADASFANLNNVLDKVSGGEGSISKLLSDPKLYENLESTSKHLSLLLQDLRLNPKRYVGLSLFGKKQKDYVKPELDPALKN